MLLGNMLQKELLALHTFFPSCNWKHVVPFFPPTRIKCFSSSKTFLTLKRWGTQVWRAWLKTWRSCWSGTRSCCWPTLGQTHCATSGPASVATGLSWPLGSWKQKYSKLQTPGKCQGVHTDVLFATLLSSAEATVAVIEQASGNAWCC